MTDYIDKYLSFYRKIVPELTDVELNFIKPYLKLKKIKKGEFYLKQGEVQKTLGFILTGLTRQYYTNAQGEDITVRFTSENSFCTDYNAFIQQKKTNYTIKCLEETFLIELDYKYVQEGYSKYKNYERFGRIIAEIVLKERQKQIESLLFETAEKRYLNFMAEHSELLNRVSILHLSSYLGIKRQSLSRIRKHLLK